ncbi:MAG: hypothetical protein ACRCZ0_10010 [Cetobacterium sp.]
MKLYFLMLSYDDRFDDYNRICKQFCSLVKEELEEIVEKIEEEEYGVLSTITSEELIPGEPIEVMSFEV